MRTFGRVAKGGLRKVYARWVSASTHSAVTYHRLAFRLLFSSIQTTVATTSSSSGCCFLLLSAKMRIDCSTTPSTDTTIRAIKNSSAAFIASSFCLSMPGHLLSVVYHDAFVLYMRSSGFVCMRCPRSYSLHRAQSRRQE